MSVEKLKMPDGDVRPVELEVGKPWEPFRPLFLPPGWDGFQKGWRNRKTKMSVIVDCSKKADGKFWTHVSFAYPNKMPSYYDCTEVKRIFLGDKKALMVFAPQEFHVNIHSYCLHLWACEDGDPLPEFSGEFLGKGSI